MQTIAAIFDSEAAAREAYDALQDAGLPGDHIGLVMRQESVDERREEVQVTHETSIAGAALGAVMAGSAGWWAAGLGVTAIAVPVVGPIVAAGAIATLATAAGGVAGWLAGGLIGRGMPEPEARRFQEAAEHGLIVMTVNVPSGSDPETFRGILAASGATTQTPRAGHIPAA